MKDNEWIAFGEELPKLAKEIEVLNCEGTIEKTKALLSNDCESIVFKINGNSYSHHKISRLDGWRYPVEKRPDFSKLRKGDLVIIICDNNRNSKVGYISNVENYDIYTSRYADTAGTSNISNSFSEIKKITRINLEEKTFEEI